MAHKEDEIRSKQRDKNHFAKKRCHLTEIACAAGEAPPYKLLATRIGLRNVAFDPPMYLQLQRRQHLEKDMLKKGKSDKTVAYLCNIIT